MNTEDDLKLKFPNASTYCKKCIGKEMNFRVQS